MMGFSACHRVASALTMEL